MTRVNKINIFITPIPLNFAVIRTVLCCLFFISGYAALVYQIMWQRMLFTLFGVDLQSITIVVSVFMFGLGMGGIIGGIVADLLPSRLLLLYIAIEFGIALFGFLSPNIILFLGKAFFSSSELIIGSASFIILAIPTILMGMTFPILVTHVNTFTKNIGESVGTLYFANTLGGALGAYFSGFILLYSMTLSSAIHWAAALNFGVALVALLFFKR